MKLFGVGGKEKEEEKELKPLQLLVIMDLQTKGGATDFAALLKDKMLPSGRPIRVLQGGWRQLSVMADSPHSSTPCIVNMANCDQAGPRQITMQPDLVLVRNEVFSPGGDFRNVLFGLMFGNVPSVNSLDSIYVFCERPVIQARLNALNRKHGDKFPVVSQSYFDSHKSIFYGNKFPAVVKVGAAHAGYGKMKVENHKVMEDVKSVLAVPGDQYLTAEPFIDGDYDVRVQKIGEHYRAFKRVSLSGAWKTNTGSAHLEELKMTDDFKFWADVACEAFAPEGGLDILTIDAIHDSNKDRFLIMEVNGTSSGLCPGAEEEDNGYIAEIVFKKATKLGF